MHNYRLPAIILVVVLEAHQQPLLNELTVELLSLELRVITMANIPSVSISIRDLLISFPISGDNPRLTDKCMLVNVLRYKTLYGYA